MRPAASLALVLLAASGLTGCSGASSGASRAAAPAPGPSANSAATSGGAVGPSVGPSSGASVGFGSTGSATSGPASGSSGAGGAAPTPGSIARVVPPRAVKTLAPVKLSQPATVSPSLKVRVSRTRIGTVDAKWPGETSGKAWIVTLEVGNSGTSSVPLGAVTVTARDRSGAPLDAFTSAPATTLPDAVSAASTATATYVFRLPKSVRNPVTLTFSQSTSTPTVQLSGSVS